ncbi:Uncharacterised protein [uncultured archaeon]|nr:Uncharacterised protein [uncultured archaeon]
MGKTIALSSLLLLLAISGIASAATIGWEESRGRFENMFGGSGSTSWLQLGVVALSICIAFNTLMYMAGSALQSEHLKKYAEGEFLHVTASSMLIFFSVFLLSQFMGPGGTGGFAQDYLGGGSIVSCAAMPSGYYKIFIDDAFGSGPLGAFKCKLQEKITALDKAYDNLFKENMGQERFTSLCISAFGVPVYCGDWSLQKHQQVEMNHLVANKIVGLLMPLHAEFVLVEYIQNNMLTVFLPLGLLLRILPVTRGVGGLFIAVAIGFYFVFPIFYILTDPTYVKIDQAAADMQAGMCFSGFKGVAVVLSSQYVNAGDTGLALGNASELVFQLSIATLFYPFVAFVIAMIFIRAVTPLLGGDTGELMRMAMRLG